MMNISANQKTIWLTQNIYAASPLYNVGGYAAIEGDLDQAELIRSIELVLSQADVIEMGYNIFEDQKGFQENQSRKIDIDTIDFSLNNDSDKACLDWMSEDITVPFDQSGNLLKIRILKCTDRKFFWYTKVHHLIFDGYSMSLFFNKVIQYYSPDKLNFQEPDENSLRPYLDFINGEKFYRLSDEFIEDKAFWKSRLKDLPSTKAFSTSLKTPLNHGQNSERLELSIERVVYDKISLFCKQNRCTPFHYFISILFILNKCYGNDSPVIGIPVFNRRNRKFKNTLGTFVNVLPFSIPIEKGNSFAEVILQVRNELKDCYKHQQYPLFDILEDLDRPGNIYNVYFSYQKNIYLNENNTLNSSIKFLNNGAQQEDLVFHLLEYSETDPLILSVDYIEDVFDKVFIVSMLDHFDNLIRACYIDPLLPIFQLPYLQTKEKYDLLTSFNAKPSPGSSDQTVIELFEEQVRRNPDAIALIFEDKIWSYAQLNVSVNRFGNYLLTNHNIRPGDLIAIQLERNESMVIGILGVLKSGGAYVPIDPDYPVERIEYLLQDSACKLVIDQNKFQKFVSSESSFSDENLKLVNDPSSLAYIIYTSGSTGKPKGVMIQHSNLSSFLHWCKNEFSTSPYEVVFAVTSICFDLSIFEILYTLVSGKKMRLLKNALSVKDYVLSDHHILLNTVPSVVGLLLSEGTDLTNIKVLNMAGEVIPSSYLSKLDFERAEIRNLYGPSEDTTYSTFFRIRSNFNILIGRPISNTQVYILGNEDQLLPIGVTGEICLGGDGLALGYLNQPVLTAEKFVPNPHHIGKLMYRTGDLGRWLSDGNIELVGRRDDQVKIRGYRIEPGEIENILQGHEGVTSAIILAPLNNLGERELRAYVTGQNILDPMVLNSYLEKVLPAYMLPQFYMQLDEIPLTANGKVDRKKLEESGETELGINTDYIAPRNKTEERLIQIWSGILGREIGQIGARSNFFRLGGHSLKATRLISQIYKVFGVKLKLNEVFSISILEDQALLIEGSYQTGYTEIPLAAPAESYVLSSSQRRLWILSQFSEGNIAYNVPGSYLFEGELDVQSLQYSFDALIARHEILRTVFRIDKEGDVRQYIQDENVHGFEIGVQDFCENDIELVHRLVGEDFMTVFDLSSGPLLRACLYRVTETRWVFSYVMHHIISDGWSMGILLKELMSYYGFFMYNKENVVTALPLQYKDYACWQQGQLKGLALAVHKTYWLEQLSGELPVLNLLGDKPRPLVKTYNGRTIGRKLPPVLIAKLRTLLNEEGATLFMGLLATVNVLLHRYTGQEDLIIGSPIAGREHPELEGQVGLYANTTVLRSRFSSADTYRELLSNVKKITIDAYSHQDYPFDELVDDLKIERDMTRNSLFDVQVILQDSQMFDFVENSKSNGFMFLENKQNEISTSRFELVFDFVEIAEALTINLTYNDDIYIETTAERLLQHLEQILGVILKYPSVAIGKLDYLTDKEKFQLVQSFNSTNIVYAKEQTLVDLFEKQVELHPENIAVVFEGKHLSYRELDEQSGRVAQYLKSNYTIRPDDLVGIMLDRSELLIVAILAVLKSGAAYVPVDPGYPKLRKEFILNDTGAQILLTQADYIFDLDYYQGSVVALDLQMGDMESCNPSIHSVIQADHLAYVIYTSGSTGNPKGVMINHGTICNTILSQKIIFDVNEETRSLQFAASSFDASVSEIFVALISGGQLYVINEELKKDPGLLAKYITDHKIDLATIPPSYIKLLEMDSISTLKKLVTAGETAILDKGISFCRTGMYFNAYGPSESSICATAFLFNGKNYHGSGTIPIGKPISNTQVYILSKMGALQPVGVPGEICLGGAGLARGYLNQAALTAEKFVTNPYRLGERMYRTGDLGRWLADGNVEFIGRLDEQVKIRGYRVELGEIENILQGYSAITSAVVLAPLNNLGERELKAYITGEGDVDPLVLKSYLGQLLPSYMLPESYTLLDMIPLTVNGKVDRKALEELAGRELGTGAVYIAPRTETERQLVEIWSEVLGRDPDQIGISSNFFELGGHSLKAIRLTSQVYKVFGVKLELKEVFSVSILEDQALLIEGSHQMGYTGIPVVAPAESYVLSSSQRRLWILSQFSAGNVAYNVPGAYWFEGELDLEILQRSFDALISRHEILRTVFRSDEEAEVRQYIQDAGTGGFVINEQDLRGTELTVLRSLVEKDFTTVFDLTSGPLMYGCLYRVSERSWVLSYVMHHIISDGWSMGILIKELMGYYGSYQSGEVEEITGLNIQYKDYAFWQQEQLKGAAFAAHKGYWLEQFSGELPVLSLLGDKSRPLVKTYNGRTIRKRLNGGQIASFRRLLQEEGATLFMGLLAAVKVLLHRYTGQEDIIIGSPIAGREHADLEGQLGFYVNTLALRTTFSGAENYREILDRVKRVTLGGYEHQVYPFDELVDSLNLQRDMSRHPLFDVLVVLQQPELQQQFWEKHLSGLQASVYEDSRDVISKFDLQFTFIEQDEGVEVQLGYNNDIYEEGTVWGMLGHFEHLLETILKAPSVAVGRLDYLSTSEKLALLEDFNATSVAYPKEQTLVDLFAEQVLEHPEKTAVVFEGRHLSYGELDQESNRLAAYLRSVYQIVPGELIGVRLDRSEWLIISLLGVLKSGGAYVPIDPGYPEERIEFMISDSGCKVLLDRAELDHFCSVSSAYSDSVQPLEHSPSDLMYVLYTSGSTGKPKGCMLEHGGVLNRLWWMWNHYGFSQDDIILQKTTFSFDVSVWELFLPLCWGARMVMCSAEDSGSPEQLSDLIFRESVTALHFVPSMLNLFIETIFEEEASLERLSGLRLVFTSGEALPLSSVHHWYNKLDVPLHNLYGPTEASIDVTYYPTSPIDERIPIGKPISNTQIFILDRQDQLCGIGIAGEICLGGVGLARGYLNQAALTAEKFVTNPYRLGERMYRTGDLGRWLADGNVEYIGRMDEQVKIRGYRIELGEIDNALQGHAAISGAVVLAPLNNLGERELKAYITGEGDVDPLVLKSYLGQLLPSYMLPESYTLLDMIPLTVNGKVDRKALEELAGRELGTGAVYIAPRTETERQLVEIWSEVLGRDPDQIGISSNFFELGGHSLKAIRLTSQVYKVFGVKLELKEVFSVSILEDQALLIEGSHQMGYTGIPVVAPAESYVLSSSQRRLWILSQFSAGNVAYNVPGAYWFEGELDLEILQRSFDALISRHEILRTVFRSDEEAEVRQYIQDAGTGGFVINEQDLRGTELTVLRSLVEKDFTTVFDLTSGPLMYGCLYRVSERSWVLSYVMHHIISDGWSMGILIKELMGYYGSYQSGEVEEITGLNIQYKDYAFWQQEQLKGAAFAAHKGYWLEQFSGELPVLSLLGDKSRPLVKTYNGRTIRKRLNGGQIASFRRLLQEEGATLFMGLLAAVKVLLHRYTGQEDIIIGSPIAGREHADLEGQLGFYVNTLALRTTFSGAENYREILDRVKRVTLGGYEHQVYPFDELVDSLNLQRDMSRHPLFDVLVVLQQPELQQQFWEKHLSGLQASVYEDSRDVISKFDLQFTFIEQDEGVEVQLGYNNDIYEEGTVWGMLGHFEHLLETILKAPSVAVGRLDYLSTSEKLALLEDFNATSVAYPKEQTLVDLFAEQVLEHPEKTAVIFEGRHLSYGELDQESNRLAAYLRSVYQIVPGELIGVRLDRSEWLIISLLGVLKSGGAYVPIDPGYPEERIEFMISDSGCKVLLDRAELDHFCSVSSAYSDSVQPLEHSPSDLMYVLYTSGSTGKPKGCMLEHGGVLNRLWWMWNHYGFSQDDIILQKTTFSFDVSVWELFLPLCWGARMVMCSAEDSGSPEQLSDLIFRESVTALHFVPSMLNLFIETIFEEEASLERLSGLRLVFTSGEALPLSSVHHWYNKLDVPLHNLYGPTEASIDVTYYPTSPIDERIPIGKPISNTQIFILDRQDQLCGIGIAGEICLGGVGLARGYLNQAALTAEKFVTNPYRLGERMYRTGDLGRWLADGNVEYIGRMDEQVKIRGYRIELGEIDNALQGHAAISGAVVLAPLNNLGERELKAYITGEGDVDPLVLKSYLGQLLPSYMVPQAYVQLDVIPLTMSGKADRKALQGYGGKELGLVSVHVAPRTETERQLVEIWSEVLGRDPDQIGISSNFFELGGHSLKAVKVIHRVNTVFSVKIDIVKLFNEPTIENISGHIDFIISQKYHAANKQTMIEIDI
ncbi:Nonribosomal peptide synthetase [Pedobacter cryoconitis]|uniref:Nonribosomal peptide synthetase n=1 Tax=Pedobacter cryoconitis TaxID=188932 RepID=A0A127VER3_9SPHI|nr:non-ribosomal peptide synthetase [Pedobacter cryoconitis]AMP99737.1 Nonribosomal peptide synthetase [Pedobacter cryoconitis]